MTSPQSSLPKGSHTSDASNRRRTQGDDLRTAKPE